MVKSPVLEGGGWGGGVVSSRFGEEIEKRGRVTVGVVGGAQGYLQQARAEGPLGCAAQKSCPAACISANRGRLEARGVARALAAARLWTRGLGLNAPAPADFQPHNDKTAAALGCKLKVDRDAFASRSLGDGGCGGDGSMGVCRTIPANGANKGYVNLCAVPKGEALCQDFDGTSIRGGRVKVHMG